MPNRYVRESAIESERVNALSWQGEVFFRRLINRVDDFGRFTASIQLLRASLFPLQLDRVSEKDVARLLNEAEEHGLLATYEVDGKRYLSIAKWEQGRAKASKYPQPPASVDERLQTYVYRFGQMSVDAPDSDPDTDHDTDTDPDNLSLGVLDQAKSRIGSWFNRRPTTTWHPKEVKALKVVLRSGPTDEEWDLMETRYRSGNQFLRRDILTLLNNWNGELDRARQPERSTGHQPTLIGTVTPSDAPF